MKDLLPALFLVICGFCGLSLVFDKNSSSEYDVYGESSGSNSIHISSDGDNGSYATSKIHILDKENINISRDSISVKRF